MRVLIADDSVLLREGLAMILADDGHEVIGGVGTGPELVSMVDPLHFRLEAFAPKAGHRGLRHGL